MNGFIRSFLLTLIPVGILCLLAFRYSAEMSEDVPVATDSSAPTNPESHSERSQDYKPDLRVASVSPTYQVVKLGSEQLSHELGNSSAIHTKAGAIAFVRKIREAIALANLNTDARMSEEILDSLKAIESSIDSREGSFADVREFIRTEVANSLGGLAGIAKKLDQYRGIDEVLIQAFRQKLLAEVSLLSAAKVPSGLKSIDSHDVLKLGAEWCGASRSGYVFAAALNQIHSDAQLIDEFFAVQSQAVDAVRALAKSSGMSSEDTAILLGYAGSMDSRKSFDETL